MSRDFSAEDQRLGLNRPITRRDFVNGVAVSPLAGLSGRSVAQMSSASADHSFAGQSLDAAAALHALRDGAARPAAPRFAQGGEEVDLIVVGAGISGLTAAHLYRRYGGPRASVLLIDSQSDIGGHAQRNEFTARNGRRVLGYGGSEALDSPSLWSPAAHAVIRDVGIDLEQFESYFDQGWRKRRGLVQQGLYFAPEIWGGRGGLVRHSHEAPPSAWVDQCPLAEQARRDFERISSGPNNPFPDLTRSQRRARLASLTYDQLLQAMGVHGQVAEMLRGKTRAYLGGRHRRLQCARCLGAGPAGLRRDGPRRRP